MQKIPLAHATFLTAGARVSRVPFKAYKSKAGLQGLCDTRQK